MPYQPGLIPPEHRVLPEYFTDRPVKGKPGNQPPEPVWAIILAVVFFIMAVVNFNHIGITFLCALNGLICTPWGKQKLQKSLRFTMTGKIRLIFCGLLSTIRNKDNIYNVKYNGLLLNKLRHMAESQMIQ
jgi:hypothetical protein